MAGKSLVSSNDDIWDDRLLIKAYELAVNLQSSDVAKSIASDTNKKTVSSERETITSSDDELKQSDALDKGVASGTSVRSVSWQQKFVMNTDDETDQSRSYEVGDYVRATYDADNIDYEARIISIDEENDECVVKFIGYDNEQTVHLSDLVDSWGEEEKQKQQLDAEAAADVDETNDDGDDSNYPNELYRNDVLANGSLPTPPIPPMPPMLKDSLGDDSEHFSAMLMSWYMSGYYTGLYQGHKLAKQRQQQNKKSFKRK